MLSIGRSKVYELMRTGRLESVRIDASRREPMAAIEDYIGRLRAGVVRLGRLTRGRLMAGRRGNGEGSVHQRKSDGRWIAAFITEDCERVTRTRRLALRRFVNSMCSSGLGSIACR